MLHIGMHTNYCDQNLTLKNIYILKKTLNKLVNTANFAFLWNIYLKLTFSKENQNNHPLEEKKNSF